MSKLQYRHVRGDLEKHAGSVNIHIDLERLQPGEGHLTKGNYAAYDTFIRAEAVQYLRLYLDERSRGSLDQRAGRRPQEQLTDDSPLLRDMTRNTPKPISTKQIRQTVHDLYVKAGLVREPNGRRYAMCVHTLRKCFKTWLVHAGVPESHVDYMMGHVTDTYNQVDSLGVEKLRREYENSGIAIKPKTMVSEIDAIKEVIRAYGHNPEKVLNIDAFSEGAATSVDNPEQSQERLQKLRSRLREIVRQDAIRELQNANGHDGMTSRMSG